MKHTATSIFTFPAKYSNFHKIVTIQGVITIKKQIIFSTSWGCILRTKTWKDITWSEKKNRREKKIVLILVKSIYQKSKLIYNLNSSGGKLPNEVDLEIKRSCHKQQIHLFSSFNPDNIYLFKVNSRIIC